MSNNQNPQSNGLPYQLVYQNENGVTQELITDDLSDWEITGYNDNPSQRQELQGHPKLKGFTGPLYNRTSIRYESTQKFITLPNK